MCSIRRRHWNCSQKCYGSHPELSGSLKVHSPSGIETDSWKISFWSQTSWVPKEEQFHQKESHRKLRELKISLKNLDSLNQKKALQRYLGFVNYYKNYITRKAEKLNPFYQLLKTEVPINITWEVKETFDSVNKALSDACDSALKQPIPGKQLVLMTDASFRSAGYALVIADNPVQKIQSKRKTYAPVAFSWKIFSPVQLKMSIYSKEILAIYMAFLEFAHILWEATKPTIVSTDNKSVTRFFQTKAIPAALWNACDYVL